MDFPLFLVMLLLGFIGSFFSGLLGIGGAIINYPLLLFIPSILGVAHFTGQEVSTISMFQVFFASLAGVMAYRMNHSGNSSFIHKGLVLNMGISILIGSLIGGMSSKYLSDETINIIYGVLAVIAVVLMLFPSKGTRNGGDSPAEFNQAIAIVSAFQVGMVSGVVGSLFGAPLGSRMSAKIDAKYLRYGLVVFIALTAIKIWSSILQ